MKLLLLLLILFQSPPGIGQRRYDIVIQEIMADPSPVAGLPSAEWIEIRNRSREEVDLQGWRIMDAGGRSGPIATYILHPDSVLVLCGVSAVAELGMFGPVTGVTSFPSLDNDGEWLALTDANGAVMHSVEYNAAWHENKLKTDGGWSLEMINPGAPCSGNGNWTSSVAKNGGTPGRLNSVEDFTSIPSLPLLQRAYTLDSSSIVLVFDNPVDSLTASSTNSYHGSGMAVTGAFPVSPMFNEVRLQLQEIMQPAQVYRMEVDGLADCLGNAVAASVVRFGRPAPIPSGIVVNEIMFNPVPSQNDYVELYNSSNQIADLSTIHIGNRNSAGAINDLVVVTTGPWLFFPGDFFVVSPDRDALVKAFPLSPPQTIHAGSLPSFPDDKGTVLLLDQQGSVLEEVIYSEKWHFPLISNREGVALERVNPEGPPNLASNWHSASSASGYGTPGYRNSQALAEPAGGSSLAVTPEVFSPDNDGLEDQCVISYKLPSAGFVANVWIYDLHGQMVRRLVRGDLLSASGYWTWDGLNDQSGRLPTGPYIICTELFNLQGKTKRYRSLAVLARR